jgi:hypothetical protein
MEPSASRQLALGKACGFLHDVLQGSLHQGFKKPHGTWCRNAVPGSGCSIYADRPRACSGFWCEWMYNRDFGPEWKPDRAKFVVSFHPQTHIIDILVDPSLPNAWTKPPSTPRSRSGGGGTHRAQ